MKPILACAPTNANELVPGLVERYSPGIDYSLIQCEQPVCGTDMWIGPGQLAAWLAAPDRYLRLCMPCALKAAPDPLMFRFASTDSPRRTS